MGSPQWRRHRIGLRKGAASVVCLCLCTTWESARITGHLTGLRKGASEEQRMRECVVGSIVGKKWDPGILDPGPFLGQIRKVEARLGKLAKIRKSEIN